jgi:hypothetical protein
MKNDFDINIADFLGADMEALEFNIDDFKIDTEAEAAKNRVLKPTFAGKPVSVKYSNAEKLVESIKLFPGEQIHSVVRGDFIFGDFIEALLIKKNVKVDHLYISTLSMSQENVDSLAGLMIDGFIGKLTLMISNYFYSHEKNRILNYLIDKLDIDNRLSVIVVRNHTKITLLEISNIKLVLSGSSNLRSSQSIEQFVLQESPELFGFYLELFTQNIGYNIINHEVPK